MNDRISKAEIRKDAVQDTLSAAVNTVGELAGILTHAAGDAVKTLGGFATEVFEIRDAARKAAHDAGADTGIEAAATEAGPDTE